MTQLTLTALYRYPVKSLAGERLDHCDVTARGPRYDREWMVIDERGRFLTQRQLPAMCLISATMADDGALQLRAPGMPDMAVGACTDTRIPVTVWDDTVDAAPVSDVVDAWLSDFLKIRCRLVQFPGDSTRQVDLRYARPGDEVGFADGFSWMVVSQASLDDLNQRLATPVTMARFRPNLVISGCPPYAEDHWRRLRIGDVEFEVVKPCSRCNIPNIDPRTAAVGDETIRTLFDYRQRQGQVYFGQNLTHRGFGPLSVDMPVEILA